MNISYDFRGHVAFVTGGTSGIGLATARAFGRAGASVAVAARRLPAGERACAAIRAEGADAVFVCADVHDEASVSAAVDEAVRRLGRIDFAVNCAGAGGDMAPLERADQKVWDDVMAANARGVWLSMRHEIRAMAESGGAIVNMSSIYGLAGKAAHHAYVASKHAVIGMSRSVALEHATRKVRVNALCAGFTATAGMRQVEQVMPDLVRAIVAEVPMGRMATEDEIAAAALWLCSPGAAYVTGAAIAVDGGFLAA
jgi:NAD(P)-dependent dehydrogenase (short-subunit alcohol dehydrogenase family)